MPHGQGKAETETETETDTARSVLMPPVSEAQRRAMHAAKLGHSTLGIPKKVGAEFVRADAGSKLPARADQGRKRLKAAMMSSAAPRRY